MSTLQEVTEKLVTGYQPDRIILFGSRARGTARPDSDYDLLVLKDTSARRIDRRIHALNAIGHDRNISLDLDVLTPAEMLLLYRKGSPFITEIVETGKVIYMRDVTKSWLSDAEQELDVAQVLLSARKWKAACLHGQQAGEKALKAMVLEKGGTLQRTHELPTLAQQLRALGVEPKISMDDAVFLTSVYHGRYPSEDGLLPHGDPSEEDATRAVLAARTLVQQAQAS